MPMVAVAVATAVGSAITSVSLAVGLGTAAAVGLGSAAAFGIATLGGGFGLGAAVSAWATVATVASALDSPRLTSQQGGQVAVKLDTNAGVPVAFGRTASGGFIAYRSGFETKNRQLAILTVLSAGGPIDSYEGYYANDVLVPIDTGSTDQVATGFYAGKLRCIRKLGATPETAFDLPTPPFTAELPGITAAHKLSGLACALQVFQYATAKYPSGLPRTYHVFKGVKAWDPRLDSTYPGGVGTQRPDDPTTWVWTENPYLIGLQWARGRRENSKRVYGIGAAWSAIDIGSFVDGANVADVNGWVIGGVVTTADDKLEVLRAILQAGGGQTITRGAKIGCMVATPRTSLYTLTAADLAGPAKIKTSQPRRARLNRIVPKYRSEAHRWQIVPAAAVTDAGYLAEDGGEPRTREIEYPLVQDKDQVAQLAAYALADSREGLSLSLVCKPRLLNVRIGDGMTVQLPGLGVASQKCVVVGRAFSPQTMTVSLSLRSETDAKHPWALGKTGTAPPSPSLTQADPAEVDAPGVGAFTATGETFSDNGAEIPAIVIAGASDNPNATNLLVRFRPAGGATWSYLPEAGALAAALRLEITGLTPGTDYEVEAAYLSVRGVPSAFTALGTVTAGALTTPSAGVAEAVPWDGVSSRPTELTDGRIGAGLDSAGDLARNIAVARANSSALLRFTGGGLFTGELTADTTGSHTALDFVGQTAAATAADALVFNSRLENSIVRVPQPVGGTLQQQAGDVAGAVRIKLPLSTGGLDSMIRFAVDVYEYATGKMQTYEVGGYTLNGGSPAWLNYSARMIGGSGAARAVRFGISGGKWTVWIGEAAGVWQYPAITVRDVQVSYANLTVAAWESGWALAFDTSAATDVTATVTTPVAGDAIFGLNALETAGGAVATLTNFKTGLGTALDFVGAAALAYKNTASLDADVTDGTTYKRYAATEQTKLAGVETGATVGAAWGSNLADRPAELTDGRIAAGLDSAGDLARNIATARANSSALLRFTGGGLFTGELTADTTGSHTALDFVGQGPGATATEAQVMNNLVRSSVVRVKAPVGGELQQMVTSVAGGILVRLPLPISSACMLRFFVDVYEYVADRMQTYEVGGHPGGGGTWYNCSARLVGASGASRPVYFGHDGTNYCVLIGNPSTNTWSYPSAVVRDVVVSYANVAVATWETGWQMSFSTGGLTSTSVTVTTPVAGDAIFGLNALETAGGAVATLTNFKTGLGTALDFVGAAALAYKNTASLDADVTDGTTYKRYAATEQTKLAGVETGATVGAAWGTTLTGRPAELTDGRITAGLDSAGDLARNIATARANSSALLRFTGGGLFTGELTADTTGSHTALDIIGQTAFATHPGTPGELATSTLTEAQVQGRYLGKYAGDSAANTAGLQNGDIYIDTSLVPNGLKVKSAGTIVEVDTRGLFRAETAQADVTSTTMTTITEVDVADLAADTFVTVWPSLRIELSPARTRKTGGTAGVAPTGTWEIYEKDTGGADGGAIKIASGTWTANRIGGGGATDDYIESFTVDGLTLTAGIGIPSRRLFVQGSGDRTWQLRMKCSGSENLSDAGIGLQVQLERNTA